MPSVSERPEAPTATNMMALTTSLNAAPIEGLGKDADRRLLAERGAAASRLKKDSRPTVALTSRQWPPSTRSRPGRGTRVAENVAATRWLGKAPQRLVGGLRRR
jgi:hypothetical protein